MNLLLMVLLLIGVFCLRIALELWRMPFSQQLELKRRHTERKMNQRFLEIVRSHGQETKCLPMTSLQY